MILGILHPEVAFRDCEHCLEFVYNEETGKPALWRGEPWARGLSQPPCQTVCGCPKGTPEESISDRNLRALSFHRRCEAVGRFPEDPMVERNAATIQAAEAEARRQLAERDRERQPKTASQEAARRTRRPDSEL